MIFEEKEVLRIAQRLRSDINKESLLKIWPNFSNTSFALYYQDYGFLSSSKNEEVVKVKWQKEHYGNTCIHLENEYVAIWNMATLNSSYNYEELYSKIVHELFHGQQRIFNYSNSYNELDIAKFNFNEELVALMLTERNHLYNAVTLDNIEMKKKHINSYLKCRKLRVKEYNQLVNYDIAIEFNEGIATYIELKALSNFTGRDVIDLAKIQWNRIYQPNDILKYYRRGLYATGLFLALLLDEMKPDWKSDFIAGDNSFSKLLSADDDKSDIVVSFISNASVIVYEYQKEVSTYFSNFNNKNSHKVKIIGKLMVVGYDPMNFVTKNEEILHKHFLMININNSNIVIMRMCVCEYDKEFKFAKSVSFYTEEKPYTENGKVFIPNIVSILGKLILKDNTYIIEV